MAHSKENAAKPRKIAIVGAGIAGLTTAIALVRTAGIPGEDIDIYEPRAGVDYGHGAAVNLNGGNFILSKFYNISLTQMGNPIQRVVGQDVNGRTLFDVDVLAAFRDFGTEDLIDADGNVLAHFVMRDDLQAVLTQRVVDEGVVIHRGKSNAVRNVLVSDGVARLELAEASTTREYDLVIGADGVRSTIRKMVAGPEAQATYTGFRMQWGICPRGVHTESALPHGQSYQIFGDGGYALHYAAGAKDNSCQMFALAQRSDRPVDENVEYRSEEALRERIAESLKSSAMPSEVWDTFERSDRFIETGIYSHPLTKQWSRDGVCVLVGDSGMYGKFRTFLILSQLSLFAA